MCPYAMFNNTGMLCTAFTTSGPRAVNEDYYMFSVLKEKKDWAICLSGTDENILYASKIEIESHKYIPEVPPLIVLAVADGLGGQAGGKIASEVGCKTAVRSCILSITDSLARKYDGTGTETGSDKDNEKDIFVSSIENAFSAADSKVRAKGPAGCATTLVLAVIYGNRLYIAHVGDSRGYVLSDKDSPDGIKNLIYTTKDHTFVQQLVDAGALEPEEALTHPRRNMLLRAVGGEKGVPEIKKIDDEWDSVILCSDGVVGGLDKDGIFELTMMDESEIPAEVKKMAYKAGDNATLIRLKKLKM
ncbi:MAG: protein phosphatase 2C domain-containing protein [Thermoplasmata archaeon]